MIPEVSYNRAMSANSPLPRPAQAPVSHRLCVAPMMDCTDRHDRYFLRQITRHTTLYTEMVTENAVLNGDRDRLLGFHADEHPLALQVGGSNPSRLAECARIAAARGYAEVNLNVGCPSSRVQSGRFGACLMAEPALVADCLRAMMDPAVLPVTVKTRTGIDALDSYEYLCDFVGQIAETGCRTLIVHARKAWLNGLSPKQNREIPPLHYDRVYRLKADFPTLEVVINGGVTSLSAAQQHLDRVDGVMLGREAYKNPFCLAMADQHLFGDSRPARDRLEVIRSLYGYIDTELGRGTRLASITRHLLGAFQSCPGARRWRRHISEHAHRPGAGLEVLDAALDFVDGSTKSATDELPDMP